MAEIVFVERKSVEREALLELYNDAGWTAYTRSPDILEKAINNSLYVLTAWQGKKLIGLIRIVGDGLTIIYIQDILVLQAFKRQGIGARLMTTALNNFNHVRQKVLLTDENKETRKFYESLGFESCDKGQLVAFVKLASKDECR